MTTLGSLTVLVLVVALTFGLHEYRQWQESGERERFVLALKEASTPEQLSAREQERLRLLRTPWWAVWRWVPGRFRDLLGRRARRH